MEKGQEPSRAELKIFQLEIWLEPARLGLITKKTLIYLHLIFEKLSLMNWIFIACVACKIQV
jgi:hypothetical protein